jgi:TRAP-type C4-dicarboxylate transport system permease small subunit
MRQKIIQCTGKFSVFIGHACGAFYFSAIVLAVAEVVMRYIFESPTTWNLEIIMALCGSAWLLSIGAVTQQQRHITVTVLELVVKPSYWKIIQKLAIVITIVAILGLIWASWQPAMHSLQSIERSGSAFNPPLPSYLKVMLLISCFLYLLQLVSNLISSSQVDKDE